MTSVCTHNICTTETMLSVQLFHSVIHSMNQISNIPAYSVVSGLYVGDKVKRGCRVLRFGRMDQDASWYGGRPQPRPHCVRWGPSFTRKGHSSPPLFGPCRLWPNGHPSQLLLSTCCADYRKRCAPASVVLVSKANSPLISTSCVMTWFMSGTGQPSAVTYHQEFGTGKQKDEARGKYSQVRASALKLKQLGPAEWFIPLF